MKAKDIHYPSLIREMQEFGAKRSLEFESPKEAKKAFEKLKDGLNNKIEWKTPSPNAYDGSTISRFDFEVPIMFNPNLTHISGFDFSKSGYRMGYDPYQPYTEPSKYKVIRLPRKVKKQLKKFWKGKMVKSKLPFYLGISKVSQYYYCKVKEEK